MVQHASVVASVINGPESNQNLRQAGAKLRTLMFSNYAFDYVGSFPRIFAGNCSRSRSRFGICFLP